MQHFTRRNLLLALLIVSIAGWVVARELARHETARAETAGFSMIEEGLYQGGHVPEPPPGTSVVLNLCEMKDTFACETQCDEPIPDASPAPGLDWLRKRVEFVDEHRRAGKVVYVHCAAGVSRAGMVVTAYEMYRNNWTRDEALKYVRSKRPATNPNPSFMRLLAEWEKELQQARQEK